MITEFINTISKKACKGNLNELQFIQIICKIWKLDSITETEKDKDIIYQNLEIKISFYGNF